MIDKQKLDRKIENTSRAAKIPGMAVIAAREGKTVYENYVGYRDVDKELPVSEQTIFGLASLTKSVTALAIMMLQDQEKLHVTDHVVKWLPEMKKWNAFYKQHITIHHLLTHTAGFSGMNAFHLARRKSVEADPDGTYLLGEFDGKDYVQTVRDLIQAMIKENPDFIASPGEMFNYSNESYALLQEIIERASGKSFADFTKVAIFDPLHMESAMFTFDEIGDTKEVTEIYAFTHEKPKSVFHSPNWWDSASIYSAGALKASAMDVQRYLEVYRQNGKINGEQLISAELIEVMKTRHITTPTGIDYGYGLVLGTYNQKQVVGHGGGVKGISSYMLTIDDITITVLTNIAEIAAEQIAFSVLEAMEGPTVEKPIEKVIQLSAQELQPYTGYYLTNERQSVVVSIVDDGLQLRLQNNLTSNAKPIGNDQFQLPDGKKVQFIKNQTGDITGIFRGMRFIEKRSENNNGYESE